MSSSQRWLLASVLLAFSAPLAKDEIAFKVARGTTLVRTLESSYALELDSMKMVLDGEEVSGGMFDDFHMRLERQENTVVTDVFEEVSGGRPTRLVRTFDEIGGKRHVDVTTAEGAEPEDSEYQSALEGKRVTFLWNDEAGEFDAAFAEGSEGDGALLGDLREDMDLARFLPSAAVAEGDAWEIEPAAFGDVLDAGGDLALVSADDEESDDEEDSQLRDNLAGKLTGTYRGTREVDGKRLAVIELALDVNTHSESSAAAEDMPEASVTNQARATFRLAGELLWDLAGGHAASLELTGDNGLELVQGLSGKLEGEPTEQTQTMTFSGTIRYAMHFERR